MCVTNFRIFECHGNYENGQQQVRRVSGDSHSPANVNQGQSSYLFLSLSLCLSLSFSLSVNPHQWQVKGSFPFLYADRVRIWL